MLCPTARAAFYFPRRRASRAYWAPRYVRRARSAPQLHSTNNGFNQGLPCRVRPVLRLPALSCWPGQTPAHEARCAADGLPVGRRVHTVRHGQGKAAWSERRETEVVGIAGLTTYAP